MTVGFIKIGDIGVDPPFDLVVPQFVGLQPHDLRMVRRFLPNALTFVRFAVIAENENGLRHEIIQIGGQRIPFLHRLRLAHDNDLASAHHGETACSADDRRYIRTLQVTAVDDLLVKLSRHLIQGMVGNERIDLVDVIRFLATQYIYRRVRARAQGSHDIVILIYHLTIDD